MKQAHHWANAQLCWLTPFNHRQLVWLTALIKLLPEQAPSSCNLAGSSCPTFDAFDSVPSYQGGFPSHPNFLITFNEHFHPISSNDFKMLVQGVHLKKKKLLYCQSSRLISTERGLCIKIGRCLEQPLIYQCFHIWQYWCLAIEASEGNPALSPFFKSET